ncbi:MAG: hypothetical protein OEP95_06195 [Myxococcales bacterium]|nr:hypothetical protein [Myxococcales bacterium]
MAESAAFDFVCERLEEGSPLDRLAVRGTVRIALKQAGLEARSATPEQLAVVVDKILPAELDSRGVEGHEGLCNAIRAGLQNLAPDAQGDTPDAVFERLGGS